MQNQYKLQDLGCQTSLLLIPCRPDVPAATLADVTGILAAGLVAVAGLGIIPYRRNEAKKVLHKKIDQLRSQLHRVLIDAFNQEADRSVKRLHDSVDPYSRFVRAEYDKLQQVAAELDTVEEQLRSLRRQVMGA